MALAGMDRDHIIYESRKTLCVSERLDLKSF